MGFAQQFFTRVPCTGSYVLNLYQKQEREAVMLTRKQKTYSILDGEIDEDNVVVGHKSTRNTDSNKKRFKKEIIESQDDDDEVVRRSINVFEQDDITTMVLGILE